MENTQEKEKKGAAEAVVHYVQSGMLVGLGTGSTAAHMIRALANRVSGGLKITAVASSEASENLARELGIQVITPQEAGTIDLTIDGADEFDPYLQLIKGGGGALLREKILAFNSRENVIIADSGKQVSRLGAFRLPLEIIPFAMHQIADYLKAKGLDPVLRSRNGELFKTDNGNYIYDVNISGFTNISQLESDLLHIPGVVETGLFLDTTTRVLMGKGDEVLVYERNNPPHTAQ